MSVQHSGLLLAVLVALAAALMTGQVLARCGFPIPDATKRLGYVDGLRGYLALVVMMHHFDLWTNESRLGARWGDSTMLWLHNFGPGGVALFFMATGLVFYPRILRGFRNVDWRGTYLSRVFRILPLQLVMVAVAAVISLAMGWPGPFGGPLTNLMAFAMWITSYAEPGLFGYTKAGSINAYVLWSLWFEWMFYLFVLPAMALLRDLTQRSWPTFVLPLMLLTLGLLVGPFSVHPAVIFFLPLFAVGMIAFELRENAKAARVLSHPAVAVLSATLLGIALIALPGPYGLPELIPYALFFCCITAGNSFGGLFGLRGSIVLGEISFGIYLVHGTVLYLLFTFVIPADAPLSWVYATLPLAAIIAVLVSAVAHMAIERPGIALGRRFTGRPRQPFSPAIERETANLAP